MAKKKDEFADLGSDLRHELEADAKAIAEKLWGTRPPGSEKLSKAEYLDYLRAHWADPAFRQKLLLQIGPKNFLAAFAEMIGVPLEVVLDWPLTEGEPAAADVAAVTGAPSQAIGV